MRQFSATDFQFRASGFQLGIPDLNHLPQFSLSCLRGVADPGQFRLQQACAGLTVIEP